MVELIWDDKYDSSGKRTAPLRLKLPFQTVETVNESAQQRQLALDLFNTGRPAEPALDRLRFGPLCHPYHPQAAVECPKRQAVCNAKPGQV